MVARSPLRARRGFTLIEVIVASGMGVVILTALMGYFIHRSRMDQLEAQLGRLRQDSSLVLGPLGRELRQAGLGRPTRGRGDGSGEFYPGPLLFASESSLAFVVDLPRPDSSLNGLSTLAANQYAGPLPERGVALINELNGSCDVDGSYPVPCSTDDSSLLFRPSGQECRNSPRTAPSCPWAMKKYQPGEWLVVVNGMGRWVERQVSPNLFASALGRTALELDEKLPQLFFLDAPNRGWVASLDRVFYRLKGEAVERKQCWNRAGSPATVASLSEPCDSPGDGTDWEPLLRSARPKDGLTFRYFDAQGLELTLLPLSPDDLRRARRVEVRLRLSAPTSGEPVTYDTFTSVALRH